MFFRGKSVACSALRRILTCEFDHIALIYILNDNILDEEKKVKIFEQFDKIQKYMLFGILGITLVGTMFYLFEKKEKFNNNIGNQMGGNKNNNFDYLKFFFN